MFVFKVVKDKTLSLCGLWPQEIANIREFDLQARKVGFENALKVERQLWETSWKTAMGALAFEHLENPGSGYSGDSREGRDGRARARAAQEKHTRDLVRWHGWRSRLQKGMPAKPVWSHEHRDMSIWWNDWGAEWWRDVYSQDEQPSREELYWWLIAWAKTQGAKWKVWYLEIGQYEGVMGDMHSEIYLESDRRAGIWSHGVGEKTFRDLRTLEMEQRYRTVGTSAKFRWWSWWMEELEDCFMCLFVCFRSGGIE